MKKSEFTKKVDQDLISKAPKSFNQKFNAEHYIKGQQGQISNLTFLNHSMPFLRSYLDQLHSDKKISRGPQQWNKMQSLWFESRIFDTKTLPVCWLDYQSDEFLKEKTSEVLDWVNEVDNWAHSDGYCSALARLFENNSKKVLPTYKKWNRSPDPWQRRCSMVGLFYYSRLREAQPSFELAKTFVSPHFEAPEYYVQKAVGWTIREMYNVYPKETVEFISKNNYQLSSIAWVAASEKLPASIKNKLLRDRKLNRASSKS